MEYKIIESTEYFKEMMIKQYEIKLKNKIEKNQKENK
jgi:hypothetical protein